MEFLYNVDAENWQKIFLRVLEFIHKERRYMQVKLKPKTTPLTLLKYVKQKGCFPNFTYNRAEDKMLSQLNILAQRYRQSLSINDKAELLKHERKMLYEEIQNPELTLARYYPQIKGMKFSKQQKKNIEDYLTHLNLNAITRIVSLDRPFKFQQEKEEKEILIAASENINQASPIKDLLEEGFERVLSYYDPRQNKTDDIDNLQGKLIELNNDINQPKLLKKILINAKPNIEEKEALKELVNKILYSESSMSETLCCAVWGAGKYRSNKAFEKIKEIALNTDEKDFRKREFAIHSVAMYLREKTGEVRFIIGTIQNEDSIFSPLARIINDKINGRYYSQKDRELNYCEFEPQEKKEFKKLRDKYYVLEKKPNIKNKNALDRNLIPFSYILKYLVINKFKCYIQEDTFTKMTTEKIGKRDFNLGFQNSGSFNDSYSAISNFKDRYNIINFKNIENPSQANIIAHENGHTFHNLMPKELKVYINYLYKLAIKEGKALDYYATRNEREYFSQGFEAITSFYKPHKILLSNLPSSNTIYKLIVQDPELYSFINKLTGVSNFDLEE